MRKFFSGLLVAAAVMMPVAMMGCGGAEEGGDAPAETTEAPAEEGSSE